MAATDEPAASDPPVAVILPTLNGAEFIGEQLTALFAQECSTPWHLVVVDGGSTDSTLDVVESFRPTPVPMRIIRLTGAPGVNAGLNAGIAATDSTYLLIAEHDDVVAPGWMQALVDALQTHNLVGSHMDRFTLNTPAAARTRQSFQENPDSDVPVGIATGMGLRRALWLELDGFDESYRYGGNDIEFCFRAHDAGHDLILVDGAVVHYRIRADPRAAFRQHRAYGIALVRLYADFGPTYLRRRRLVQVARELIRLGWWGVRAPLDRTYLHLLATRGGLQLGLLQGSLKYRRWFP